MDNLSIILAQSYRLVFRSVHFVSVIRHDSFQIYVIFCDGFLKILVSYWLFCFFPSTRIYIGQRITTGHISTYILSICTHTEKNTNKRK